MGSASTAWQTPIICQYKDLGDAKLAKDFQTFLRILQALKLPHGLIAKSAIAFDSSFGIFCCKLFDLKVDWSLVVKAFPCYMSMVVVPALIPQQHLVKAMKPQIQFVPDSWQDYRSNGLLFSSWRNRLGPNIRRVTKKIIPRVTAARRRVYAQQLLFSYKDVVVSPSNGYNFFYINDTTHRAIQSFFVFVADAFFHFFSLCRSSRSSSWAN